VIATRLLILGLAGLLTLADAPAAPQSVAVRHPEGLVHGFLSLKTLGGKFLADGDLIQNVHGDRVTSRLVFRFRDGSLHDETVVYSQRQYFHVLTDRLIQKGPAFPRAIDMTIDSAAGNVTVQYSDDGDQKVATDRFETPVNLANGMVSTLLKNVRSNALPEPLAFIAATPKPRMVKLAISAAGVEPFSTGGMSRKAMHYVVKVKIGGIPGLIAPLVGKEPPDAHVWILAGDAPAFVRAEQPFFADGPLWRIELVSPAWK